MKVHLHCFFWFLVQLCLYFFVLVLNKNVNMLLFITDLLLVLKINDRTLLTWVVDLSKPWL